MITVHKALKAGLSPEEVQKLTEGVQLMSLEEAQDAILPLFGTFQGLAKLAAVFQAAIRVDKDRKDLEKELTEAKKALKKLLEDTEAAHGAFESAKGDYKKALEGYSEGCRVERERLDAEIADLKRQKEGLAEELKNRRAECEAECKNREQEAAEAVRKANAEAAEAEERRDSAERDFQLLQQRWGIT